MTDAQLEAKFQGLSDPVLSAGRTRERINACWSVGNAAHVKALVALAVPGHPQHDTHQYPSSWATWNKACAAWATGKSLTPRPT
jgi:hypothetical protein